MTTEKSIVSAVIAEEEEAVDNIRATIIEFENKIAEATQFIGTLRTKRDETNKYLGVVKHNGIVYIRDVNGRSLDIGDRIAIVGKYSEAKLRLIQKVEKPNYSRSRFGKVTGFKRINSNGKKIFKVEFRSESGEKRWRKASHLLYISGRKSL